MNRADVNKKKTRLIYILLFVSIAVAIGSAIGLGIELYTTRQGQQYYTGMTSDVERRPWRPDVAMPPVYAPASPAPTEPGSDSQEPEEPIIDVIDWIPYVDFDELNQTFRGLTAAWMILDGTVIDYPVMQSTDNDYFLRRLPDGSSHRNGSLFIDYRNNPDFSDRNTLIYGHDMRSGDMFGVFRQYRNQDFFDQHNVFYIFTPERDFALILIAGYVLDSAVETPPLSFEDDDAFLAHIENIRRRSVFRSDVEVSAEDRIVSLCTCDASHRNNRLIIVGKLVDLGP